MNIDGDVVWAQQRPAEPAVVPASVGFVHRNDKQPVLWCLYVFLRFTVKNTIFVITSINIRWLDYDFIVLDGFKWRFRLFGFYLILNNLLSL